MTNLPLARFPYLVSDDVGETRETLTQLFGEHLLELLRKGDHINARVNAVRLVDVVLLVAGLGCAVRLNPAGPRAFYIVVIPMEGHGTFFLDGKRFQVCRGVGIIVSPEVSLDVRLSANFRATVLRIDEDAVRHVLARRLGFWPPFPVAFDPLIDITRDEALDWYHEVTDCITDLDDPDGLLHASDELINRMDRVLVGRLVAAQSHEYSNFLGTADEPPASSHAVSFALGLMHGRPTLSMEDFATRAGVSVHALYEGCRRHFNINPSEYLHKIRLRNVHSDLEKARPGSVSVREVVAGWALFYSERFLVDYYALFGESPEDTARR
ncbi:AraC family transcriptional regulator [Qaidamihabitans albus]|uniref:AraC family transcriptional regulator n=1 Tax=Qaidamihabitans albus TaxID=2795733 RepID=UPI0018F11F6F|nr:helix-turn-helix transcriptional regulator [Qaidamihabitans albus]